MRCCGRASAAPGRPTARRNVGGAFETIPAWGLPLLNTLILLTSGVTITIAHHALKAGERGKLLFWLGADRAAGRVFLFFQADEYIHAYHELNLTLGSGIYGSTFFMLTGFHGMHVHAGRDHADRHLVPLRARAISPRTTTSGSRRWRGTGTSSTWCGWACSCSSTCCEHGLTPRCGSVPQILWTACPFRLRAARS